jgi:hypothetical protein
MLSVTVPVVAMLLAVIASVALSAGALGGFKMADSPLDIPDATRPTLPLKPPVRLTMIVLATLDPCTTVRVPGFDARVKPPVGAVAVTVSANDAVTLVTPDPAAVIVSVYVPVVADTLTPTLTTTVVTPDATCGTEFDIVTPLGAPLTEIVAGPVNPFEPATRTVIVVDEP